jgi:DNA-binding NtrC family response regulator
VHEGTNLRIGLITGNKPLETRLSSGVNHGCEITPFASLREFPGKLHASDFAAILLDVEEEGITVERAANAVKALSQAEPQIPVMALARPRRGFGARLKAAGADEVVPWNIESEQLLEVLQQLLTARAEQQESERQRRSAERYQLRELIGNSESMMRVYDSIYRVAGNNTTVMIRGESGTGKELVARAIQASGPRAEKPFVAVNCAAIPDTLIESELFGYEKGAFTGATQAHEGHFEAAHTGTIFLDEIGSLNLSLQGKLLRVLEEHTIQRIGSKKPQKIDFRLITATNEDLEDMVRLGKFREDLFYRIHVVPVFLPPLRERADDIALLVDYFVGMYCSLNSLPEKRIEPDALEVLEDYSWPGNVRELENLIQRLVLMTDGKIITVRQLPQNLLYHSAASKEALLIPEEGIVFDDEISRIECAYLQAALRRTEGKKVAAAALLHISPQKMKYLCRKYRI